MAAISQTTFSNAFSRTKMYNNIAILTILTILQHWFREWLGAGQATNHYRNQWWLIYRRIYASIGLNKLTSERNITLSVSTTHSHLSQWLKICRSNIRFSQKALNIAHVHSKLRIVMMPTFSSLVASIGSVWQSPVQPILTKVGIMTTPGFQCHTRWCTGSISRNNQRLFLTKRRFTARFRKISKPRDSR